MEELKHELEKLSKTYVDTPEKEEKILIPFIKRLLELSVKERRKLLPTIRELQWIKGKFSETFCDHHRAGVRLKLDCTTLDNAMRQRAVI